MSFLLTDILLFTILIIVIISIFFWRKKPTWYILTKKLKNNYLASISIVILSIYFLIAMLDSVHIPISVKVDSSNSIIKHQTILETLCTYWLPKTEKTYSAPLSLYSFSKENIPVEKNSKKFKREFPRLNNVSHNIQNNTLNLLKLLLMSIFFSVIVIGCIIYLYSYFKKQDFFSTASYLFKNPFLAFLLLFLPWLIISIGIFSSEYHILGTNKAGFDVFYIALKSIRTAIIIGILTTLIVTPLAIMFGVLAGYFGGIIDDIIQFIYTTLESIPSILLIAAIMLIVDTNIQVNSSLETADLKLFFLCTILGITSWTNLCRLIRAETLKVREFDFITVAKSMQLPKWYILAKHILPNVIHIVLITMILRFSGLVLAEAILTYVGIGVDSSIYSWGNMINQARFELARSPLIWWNLVTAFSFMLLLVLAANILADVIRDTLDPKLRSE